MKIKYYIIDPAGNITALVTTGLPKRQYSAVARAIMRDDPSVEQVGFAEFENGKVKLNMSGDEFCGNAIMSAAALYYNLSGMTGKFCGTVDILPSNKAVGVAVSDLSEYYRCEAVFEDPEDLSDYTFSAQGVEYTFPAVSFAGITHIVADGSLSESAAKEAIRDLAADIGAPALGIMIYEPDKGFLKPLVYVSAVDTLFLENSCASGSCAVAFLKAGHNGRFKIIQPGGVIEAEKLAGGIRLCSLIKIKEICFKEI